MGKNVMNRLGSVAALMGLLVTAGCSGGGSSGTPSSSDNNNTSPPTVTGLAVASNVSVVDAQQQSSNGKLLAAFKTLAALSSVPANSDYNKDTTNVYVNEKAGEAFKTVNMILCMIEQTKYADMVNKGFYKAMVDSQSCQGNDDASKSGSSSQGGSSASSAPSYDTWTVNSERASSTSPQVLTAYVHMAKGGPANKPMTIHAKMTITEGKSATNPLGIFTMNIKGFMDTSPSTIMMKGILKTERDASGRVVIKFAEKEYGGAGGAVTHNVRAAYIKDDTAKTGQGSAYKYENYGQLDEGTINFAYNASLFKRVNAANNQSVCLDRTKFETSAWRYGVYSSSGSRKNMNGGFPINTKKDGTGAFGYLGYYGLNLPPGVTPPADGDKVYKQSWNNGAAAATEYTLVTKKGKLKKHTRSLITLNDIKNIPLEGNIPAPGQFSGNKMYRVSWDGTDLAIRAQATMSTGGPPAWEDLATPTKIDNTYNLPFSNLSLFSQALGGQVNINLTNCVQGRQGDPNSGYLCSTPTGNTQVVFYKEGTVTPTDTVPATLSCFDNCPKAATSAGLDSSSQAAMTYQMTFPQTKYDYTFENMLLKDKKGGYYAILATAPSGQSWGFNSGPLFDPSAANMTKLECDWTPPPGQPKQYCGWNAWNKLDEFYTWETGPNSWNQFSAVKDASNNYVKFDPPMQALYVHSQTDSTAYDYKYNGTKFYLQYNGFGELNGIPGKCFDPANGTSTTDCSKPGMRWVPEFTIPADSQVTMGGIPYLVKPLEVEQRMKKNTTAGACSALTVTDMSGSFPDVDTEWVDPGLATEPDSSVTGTAPKVIAGVVQ